MIPDVNFVTLFAVEPAAAGVFILYPFLVPGDSKPGY